MSPTNDICATCGRRFDPYDGRGCRYCTPKALPNAADLLVLMFIPIAAFCLLDVAIVKYHSKLAMVAAALWGGWIAYKVIRRGVWFVRNPFQLVKLLAFLIALVLFLHFGGMSLITGRTGGWAGAGTTSEKRPAYTQATLPACATQLNKAFVVVSGVTSKREGVPLVFGGNEIVIALCDSKAWRVISRQKLSTVRGAHVLD